MIKRPLASSIFKLSLAAMLFLLIPFMASNVAAQEQQGAGPDRAKIIAAAREIMTSQEYCALVTLDENGRPQVRTLTPFPPDENMIVWFATNVNSRKVQEIRKDPRVCVYYADHSKATGYVALSGRAELIDDMKEILRRKRAYWDNAFEKGLKNLILIKVVPEQLDMLNYKQGVVATTNTWRSPSITFPAKNAK